MKFSEIVYRSITNHSGEFQFVIPKDSTKNRYQIDLWKIDQTPRDQSIWTLFLVESFGFANWNFQ